MGQRERGRGHFGCRGADVTACTWGYAIWQPAVFAAVIVAVYQAREGEEGPTSAVAAPT